ncbi:hypothetical protein L6164_030628 [Bauhinia variegata]|uniref:Uncharacterized protein n=1 Tax=Bauhinia variegata TaxID=167791 RepID=A0ACB9LE86_BAUVA|nr:hypothetical protein L6164_030628 [Bauhinia variegata]
MAMKHRKLFPALTRTNQTQDCSGFCDPACPYNCYSFPEYYFSPPPPSPPISAADNLSQVNNITPFLIILVTLFIIIFVVMIFYVIKAKCCGWRGIGSAPSQSESFDEDFLDGNQVDHPIWLITTVGLQQSIINSITVFKYRKSEGLIEGTECSVCLNEFHEGEALRLLPKCNHAFHIPCIDTWLRSHTNCPLCRAGVVSTNVSSEGAMPTLPSTELRRNQETQMGNLPNDAELSNNIQLHRLSEDRDRNGTREAQEFIEDAISKERRTTVDGNHFSHQLNDEIQTVTRSVSIGSALAHSSCPGPGLANSCPNDAETHPQPVNHMQDDSEQNPVNLVKQDGQYPTATMRKPIHRSSIEQCLHISPVSMKRSFSCGGRIVSTKGYKNLNTILPY